VLVPNEVAADQVVGRVVRGDHEPVVVDHLREQLPKALVDMLELEAFAEFTRDVQQDLGDLRLALQISIPTPERTPSARLRRALRP
jgi:hypothetical protein